MASNTWTSAGYIRSDTFRFGRIYKLLDTASFRIEDASPHPVWIIDKDLAHRVYAWHRSVSEFGLPSIHASVNGNFVSDNDASYLIAVHVRFYTEHPGVRQVAAEYEAKLLTKRILYPQDDILFPIKREFAQY